MEPETDNELRKMDDAVVKAVCDQLKQYNNDIMSYIVEFVAALCCVSSKTMMSNNDKRMYAEPRWLVWYACRYITNGGFCNIADMSSIYGHKFTGNAIQRSVGKMSQMIDNTTVWNKRWRVLKSMIDIWDSERIEKKKKRSTQERIVISIPKELQDRVKVEFKYV